MANRIVIHAGFHKTGTTSIQRAIAANKRLLRRKGVRTVLRDQMIGLCEAARAYSQDKDALNLGLLTYEAAECAIDWHNHDGAVLISSEDLAGHMPGRRGVSKYDAAPVIMTTIAQTFAKVAKDTLITFVFTTRKAEPWLASCHAQHLRATRMTLGLQAYATDFAASADLSHVVEETRNAVQPHTVETLAIEQIGASPLAPFARLCGLPEAAISRLSPVAQANVRPDEKTLQALLDLNRSNVSDSALAKRKRELLQRAT